MVCQRNSAKGDRFEYEYDFGDGWKHEIKVEKVLEPEAGVKYPTCIAGERACPPEESGIDAFGGLTIRFSQTSRSLNFDDEFDILLEKRLSPGAPG